MNTKGKTKLWLLEKNLPIFTHGEAQGFHGCYPPTAEEVLMQIYLYKRYHRELGRGNECQTRSALTMAAEDLLHNQRWGIIGIDCKTKWGIIHMRKEITTQYDCLLKTRRNLVHAT